MYSMYISIHAPRVGSDCSQSRSACLRTYFNPRSPCGERHVVVFGKANMIYFNPRSPCGERPLAFNFSSIAGTFQSTLPVWGATSCPCGRVRGNRISIHAPRVGSDRFSMTTFLWVFIFQSTLPVWGATPCVLHVRPALVISIHAPRVGSDIIKRDTACLDGGFQSTLPVWGATATSWLNGQLVAYILRLPP